MKNIIFKIAMGAVVIAIGSYGCKKKNTAQEEHAALDKKDNSTIVSIQAETKNAVSSNNSLIMYHDSLTNSSNQILSSHYTSMMHYYDNLYHHADSICHIYQGCLNNIHTCGMMSQCQSMMGGGNMMGGNGMMGGSNSTYHCSLMNYITNNCSDDDNVRNTHTKYCTR
jgi:hypothetical protein